MCSKVHLSPKSDELTGRENRPSSQNNHQETRDKTSGTIETQLQESSEKSSSSRIANKNGEKPIVIDGRRYIRAVAFLVDGKHVASGGRDGNVRCWRVEDGVEVGTPMDAGGEVFSIAVSQDGKWIVSGTERGLLTVWNAESHEKVNEFTGHSDRVGAVDVSPGGTRIATGSKDKSASVWSLSTGERLVGWLKHDHWVAAVKFSPDGYLIATATWNTDSVRIYNSQDGRLLFDDPIQPVGSTLNGSLAWSRDSKQLFALSHDGNIICLDASTGNSLSTWPIHKSNNPRCISLASNGVFIAASGDSSVSFWNTRTREQIGPVIKHAHDIWSMALSANYDLVVGGEMTITLRRPCDILPSSSKSFHDDDGPHVNSHPNPRILVSMPLYGRELPVQLSESQQNNQEKDSLMPLLRAPEENSSSVARLEKTVRELRDELAKSERAASEQKDSLNEIIRSLRADLFAQRTSLNEQIGNLEKTIQQLCDQSTTSHRTADQEKDSLLRARDKILTGRLAHLEQTNQALRDQLADSQHKVGSLGRINCAHEQKHQCESLFAQDRISDAAESLLEMSDTINEDVRDDKLIVDWLAEFTRRCITTLEKVGDDASNAEKQDEAVAAYSTALLLGPLNPDAVMMKWARIMLSRGSSQEALNAAAKFKVPRFIIYRIICEVLEEDGRLAEAVECFRQMQNELPDDTCMHDLRAPWQLAFRDRCAEKLEKMGDASRESKNHDEAIGCYSNALLLEPTNRNNILLKRSNEVIELDPSSHKGYEGMHDALHGMGRYREALEAFRTMLSKIEKSPDPHIRELRRQYFDATATIRKAVEQTIRPMPRVLIDTVSGRLYDKVQQAAAFEELPIYDELRSSMTTRTRLDHARIRKEVKEFYRYVMLSHKWQPNEPTFQTVENVSIYGLPQSPTNSKLQKFCKLVRTLRFVWAWSDTCCVNQLDKGVQQESLVAMFRWYQGSFLTVVHLLGVRSESQEFGCLWKSIWNTRGWTYQEYVASEVVQFYTEDWEPYLGLDMFNHKESPKILSEMEQAMDFSPQQLATLQPGLEMAREKLYLASMRQTTREEDIAYCLFGIFNVAIPIIYGEGNQSVGRLLEYILRRSDNVTLLAWTGSSGSQHSYLPADLTVYNQIVPPHVPSPIETVEMEGLVTALRSSLPDFSLTVALYERLNDHPPLSLVAGRLRLPGIVFPLTDLVPLSESDSESDLPVYHATSPMLGDVEIKTATDLSGMDGLLLINPWISPLLDQDFSSGEPLFDQTTRALRLVVRLKQPFGALLLAPMARVQYRRIATDSLITVRVRDETSSNGFMEGIRTIDIQ